MSAIFGFLFIIIVIVLIVGFSILSGILRLFFGFGRKQNDRKQPHNNPDASGTQSRNRNNMEGENVRPKKVFGSDEGEYVDFEEIKDEPRKK